MSNLYVHIAVASEFLGDLVKIHRNANIIHGAKWLCGRTTPPNNDESVAIADESWVKHRANLKSLNDICPNVLVNVQYIQRQMLRRTRARETCMACANYSLCVFCVLFQLDISWKIHYVRQTRIIIVGKLNNRKILRVELVPQSSMPMTDGEYVLFILGCSIYVLYFLSNDTWKRVVNIFCFINHTGIYKQFFSYIDKQIIFCKQDLEPEITFIPGNMNNPIPISGMIRFDSVYELFRFYVPGSENAWESRVYWIPEITFLIKRTSSYSLRPIE